MRGMKSSLATHAAAMHATGARPPASLYLAGPFSMGYLDFFTFLIPLYGLSLGLDASEIGVLVGARSILALFLSIHIGVLMDRFGTRAVTLVFVWTGMVLAPLFRWRQASGHCYCCSWAGRAMRLGNPQRTMLNGTALSVLLIAATPLLGGLFALLLLFQLARGWLEGVIQPVILSVQALAVGRHQQGAVVGLRQTGQRLSSILIPPVMGGVADRFGTSQSFLLYAALMLPLCGLLMLIIHRLQQPASNNA